MFIKFKQLRNAIIKTKENKMKLNYQALNHVLRHKMNDIVYITKEGKYAVIKAEDRWTASKLFEFLSVYTNNISVDYSYDKITILL